MIPPIKEPDLALAGLALLIIFGLLIWYDRPIEGFRPSDPYGQPQDPPRTTGYAYESWLWQDPFAFEKPDESWLWQHPFTFEKPDPRKGSEECEFQLNEKINHIENDVKILAPLLKVWPNTKENKEVRTRHHYAVIAGLIESGYRPSEPNRSHFCSSQKNSSNKEYDVRWEHFESKNKPDIIVAWLNSEIFTLDGKLTFVLENLLISKGKNINFYVYDLDNILDQNLPNIIKPAGAGDVGNKALIEKLTSELALRNIRESSEVIVITEQDSENVRNLSNNFRVSLRDSFPKDKPCVDDAESSTCEIKNVFYLKGLDAYQKKINKQNKTEDQAANKRADRLSVIDLHNPSSLPLGPGQLDYVHRLAEQIKGSHNEIDLQKRNSGIKAVGVFGSNFNDKLLILEALRAKMPDILVFTTDLDAQMLNPQYWPTTRNLVVVSDFNLLLREKDRDKDEAEEDKSRYPKQSYQGQFPAFRDSQQTNIFYRTISMVNDDLKKSEPTSPQIFEIGRNGFVRLGSVLGKNGYHPSDDTLEQAKSRLWLLWAIISVLIVFYWVIRPNSRKSFIWLLSGISAIYGIALFVATDDSGEPLSFTDGTSLWPTVFIQLIAISLAGAFFFRARGELDENFSILNRQYFSSLGEQYFQVRPNECGSWPCFIFIWTFIVYAINDVYPSWFPFWQCLVLLVLPSIPYLYSIEKRKDEFNFNSVKDWIEKDNYQPAQTNQDKNSYLIRRALHKLLSIFFLSNNGSRNYASKENYEVGLWRQYYHYGLLYHRVSRVVGIWLFFAIIETILIYLLPPWPLPCRGATCDWVSWTGVISFVVIMILLFFVLDSVRLSFYWIQKLRKQHPLLAENFKANDADKTLQSLEDIVAVIAERTRVVDRLIYYPMLCIMLMLIAKITYFDNQDFPLSKGFTFAASISLLFFSGFMLRYEAEQLKISVIKSAKKLGKDNRCDQKKVANAIERINGFNDGAFQPMFEQPVMRALLIILAFVSIFASEYLKLLG
ncbi:MAG: hypothetical protein ABI284_08745 [Nitrosospira sp.]